MINCHKTSKLKQPPSSFCLPLPSIRTHTLLGLFLLVILELPESFQTFMKRQVHWTSPTSVWHHIYTTSCISFIQQTNDSLTPSFVITLLLFPENNILPWKVEKSLHTFVFVWVPMTRSCQWKSTAKHNNSRITE